MRPLIFITNDDGYRANGIQCLIEATRPFGDIVVVAPNNSKSAQSHAITVKDVLRLTKVSEEEGLIVYRSSGSPVDCVKFGLKELGLKPDLILSGINHGSNASVSVHYSGTMGATKEGCISGIPSVGFSLDDFSAKADFSNAVEVVKKIVPEALANPMPLWTCLNVNIPKVEKLEGIKVCKQAYGAWNESFIKRRDPHGQDYYWLSGQYELIDEDDKDTDEYALKRGYASVVPTTVDTTDYKMLDSVKSWNI